MKKLPFLLVNKLVLSKKSVKVFLSISKRVLLLEEFIIVWASIFIVENLKSLVDLIKLHFCVSFILSMPGWMPFSYHSFVGFLDIKRWGIMRNA